jgi:hypothetical protein
MIKGKLSDLRFINKKEPQAGNSQDNSDDEPLNVIDDVDDVDDEELQEE